MTPLQYFKLLFNDNLLGYISEQSNVYCAQEKVKHNLKCKLLSTDKNEIEQLIGGVFVYGNLRVATAMYVLDP